MSADMVAKLPRKQRVFVEQYLQCWNATEAARRAGYSPKTAQEQGSRLLSNVMVSQAVAARIAEHKATADEVLLRLASHSRGSLEDFLTGESIDLDKARQLEKLHLVKKLKVTTTTDKNQNKTERVELELYDAQEATVQLARILGLYVERIEVSDLRDKSDSELVREFAGLLDTARARARGSDRGGA